LPIFAAKNAKKLKKQKFRYLNLPKTSSADVSMNPSAKIRSNSRHLIFPALMTMFFFAVALSPINMLGCRTRGLLAFAIALVSGFAALFTAFRALKVRLRGDGDSQWWVISTLILTIPVVAMIIMA
jgi:heme O synthase-like polyprenyltransferase